jgi:hypothetical protein
MMPVTLDVIAPLPEGWGLCQSCELLMARAGLGQAPPERGLEDLPPEWRADFERLSVLIFDLENRYVGRLVIRIYDPRSLRGLVMAVRHRAHRYPTFVVAGQTRISGWDVTALDKALAERVHARSADYA